MDIIERIEAKLDKLDEKIDGHSIILAKQEQNLADHMKRSDALEKHVSLLEEDLKPIKNHVSNFQGIMKFIGVLALVIGIIVGIMQIISLL